VDAADKELLTERDRRYEQQFEAIREATAAALASAKEAVAKAESANERRFESVNEFRAQLNDMIASLISKDVAEARFKALETMVRDVNDRLNRMKGREDGISVVGAIVVAVPTLIVGVVGALIYRH
jgi:vacuolar-type H+-ATPase subunit E/Vma4